MSEKTLIIAEKPSVAADLARVLGKVPKNGDFYENDELVISSAIGHLVELYMPEDFDPKWKRWSMDNLPMLPGKFGVKAIAKSETRFKLLKKLMKRKDVGTFINACDAGREGELIFAYLYDLVGAKKESKRMWMNSMTPGAIKEAYGNLRTQETMQPLEDAARCRSESDWLIGINGTRAVTGRLGFRSGQAATVGRVQTPTLALICEREEAIRKFKPTPYWRLSAEFTVTEGSYSGLLERPGFDSKNRLGEHDRAERIWNEADTNALLAAAETASAKNAPGATVTDTKKRTRQSAPRLYDLTTLQREANGRYGFPAGMTLKLAQSLYEKHKMLTYPRTDSRALPSDYPDVVKKTLGNLPTPYDGHAAKVIKNGWIKPGDKRVFNDAKVSDHFAIIPTGEKPKKLSEPEEKLYDMVVRRFIATFYPMAEFDETARVTTLPIEKLKLEGNSQLGEKPQQITEINFKTSGKVLVEPGWLAVYGKDAQGKDSLPALVKADGQPAKAAVEAGSLATEEDATRPPPRYSEATLLAAMEGAGKLVEDEELAEAMKERGLGTPATRANMIDHIIYERYILREGRELIPTAKAENLIKFLHVVGIEALTSPALTGDWEYKLRQIEQGELSRGSFMAEIEQLTTDIVERAKSFNEIEQSDWQQTELKSPIDGAPLRENFRCWQSEDESFTLLKTMGNRPIETAEAAQLIDKGEIGPLDGFRSRAGKPFSGLLRLDTADNYKAKFVFENTAEGGEDVDLSQFPTIAQCPESGQNIIETPGAYVWADEPKTRRIARTILSRTIDQEQFLKMLKTGKTDLLDKFKSKRTGRFFDAHLLLKSGGGIGFEFPPRAAKKGAKKATKKSAKKATTKKVAAKKTTKKVAKKAAAKKK